MSRLELIATTAFGLEAVVARELRALGYDQQTVEDGRVSFVGDELAICRCNLWLRSAERVMLKVGEFVAADFDALFDQTTALPWADLLPVDAKFPVDGKTVRSTLHHIPTIQGMVKRAIADSLKRTHQRHWFQENGPEFPIEISLLKDRVTLAIDTSGDGLHKRGYRQMVGPAPLRETVAAALVQLSYWNPERLFLDPFCGSGTIAIEAALIGRNKAPGLQRSFVSEDWPLVPKTLWKEARDEAKSLARTGSLPPIVASDIDPRALHLAETHAHLAGVAGDLTFKELDFLEFTTTREYGVIVCNPPYGERLGDLESVEAIYDDMADACEQLTTWSIYVLTSHEGFERFFRRKADRRRKLFNGRIECHYYQFFGPRPDRPADADDPVFEPIGATEFTAPPSSEPPKPRPVGYERPPKPQQSEESSRPPYRAPYGDRGPRPQGAGGQYPPRQGQRPGMGGGRPDGQRFPDRPGPWNDRRPPRPGTGSGEGYRPRSPEEGAPQGGPPPKRRPKKGLRKRPPPPSEPDH